MESANVSSQEKLDQLFSEGKINREEYERLGRPLNPNPEPPQNQSCKASQKIPWPVWLCIGLLIVEGLAFITFINQQPILVLGFLAIIVVLIYGLYKRQIWSYYASPAFCFIVLIFLFA